MYQRNPKGPIKHLDFFLMDVLCAELSLYLAFVLRNHRFDMYSNDLYRNMAVMLAFVCVTVGFLCETYSGILKRGYYREFRKAVNHVFIVSMLTGIALLVTKTAMQYSRQVYVTTVLFYLVSTYITRLILKQVILRVMKTRITRSLLLISTKECVKENLDYLRGHSLQQYQVSGIVLLDEDFRINSGKDWTDVDGIPIVGDPTCMYEFASKEWVDEILICVPQDVQLPEGMLSRFKMMGITTHVKLTTVFNLEGERQYVEKINGITVLTNSIRYVMPRQLVGKRIMDILGGLVGTLITVILTIIIGPIIYIQSPGPIFFKQERIGKNGKKFMMYKFRSMYLDAEERKAELMKQNPDRDERMFKMEFDPRIIGCKMNPDGTIKKGIGNFIRDYSLDEFPQFINVLKGDMSIVGTRPPLPSEWEKYELHHRSRLAIKPGITGKWQTSGRSNIMDFDEVVKLDNEYIQEWNLGYDIRLLLKTVWIVLKKDGAM